MGSQKHKWAIFILFCQVWSTWATSCVPHTHFYCRSTDHVTGVCGHVTNFQVDGGQGDKLCQCRAGFTPSEYGCTRDLPSPRIALDSHMSTIIRPVQTILNLKCIQAGVQPVESYTWWDNDTVVVNNDGRNSFTKILDQVGIHQFRCAYRQQGKDSLVSSSLDIKVVDESTMQNYDIPRVQVQGMPSRISGPTHVTLVCDDFPQMSIKYFRWYMNDKPISPVQVDSPSFDLEITPDMKGNIKCSIQYQNQRGISLFSKPVSFPESIAKMPQVYIPEGNRYITSRTHLQLSLTCSANDSSYNFSNDVIFTWSKDGKVIPSATSRVLTLTKLTSRFPGWYSCTAKDPHSGSGSVSKPVKVFVDLPIKVSIRSEPITPVEGGHLTIFCDVTGFLRSLNYTKVKPLLEITWYRNGKLLHHHHDTMLQLNNVVFNRPIFFSCRVNIDALVMNSSELFFGGTASFKDVPAPVLEFERPPSLSPRQLYIFNESYVLICRCDIKWMTPGIEYQFMKDNKVVSISRSPRYRAENSIDPYNYTCQMNFNSQKSEASNYVEMTYEIFEYVAVHYKGAPVQRLDVPEYSNVTLECVVRLLPGLDGELHYNWKRDGKVVAHTRNHTFKVERTFHSNVTCQATLDVSFPDNFTLPILIAATVIIVLLSISLIRDITKNCKQTTEEKVPKINNKITTHDNILSIRSDDITEIINSNGKTILVQK